MRKNNDVSVSRRQLIQGLAGSAVIGSIAGSAPRTVVAEDHERQKQTPGGVKQSLVYWCYRDYWGVDEMCRIAKQLGCSSIELIGPEHWPILKEHGLTCALAGSHGFVQGMNNPKYHDMCLAKLRDSIGRCADAGFPAVITFTGFSEDVNAPEGERSHAIDPDEGIRHCVDGYKKIVGYAEQKNVNLSLEMLNSRVNVTMKGHPGYQGDHVDYCLEIIRQVGSPRLGLLFDIYHVQIMDGDLITRISQCRDVINHVHTAGNPGRGELDDDQEINYPPVIRSLLQNGYQGYVGQEFIPTRDPLEGLQQAVAVCDV